MEPLSNQAPWDDFAARVAELYRPIAEGDGCPEWQLVEAESRLGVRLPRILREFYLLAGLRDDLTRGATEPVAPPALDLIDHALVFTASCPDCETRGILMGEIGHDDPPVVRAEGDARPLDWVADHERLSTWFESMLYWTAAHGGLPFRGSAAVDETVLPLVHTHWPKVDLLGSLWGHLIVFHRAGQLVCIEGQAPDLTLHAASRTLEGFEAMTRKLGLTWDTDADEE